MSEGALSEVAPASSALLYAASVSSKVEVYHAGHGFRFARWLTHHNYRVANFHLCMAHATVGGRHSFSLFSIEGLFEKGDQPGHFLNGEVWGNRMVALRNRFRFICNGLHSGIRLRGPRDKRVTGKKVLKFKISKPYPRKQDSERVAFPVLEEV